MVNHYADSNKLMPLIMEVGLNDEDYNNGHRALLQAFFARGSMTFEEARPVLAACMTAQGRVFCYRFTYKKKE